MRCESEKLTRGVQKRQQTTQMFFTEKISKAKETDDEQMEKCGHTFLVCFSF